MKRIAIIMGAAIVMSVAEAKSQFDFQRFSLAGIKALQAATLTDAQVQQYTKQYIEQSDRENQIAGPGDPYAKRLERITSTINNRNGINIRVYKKKDVNAFATADGSVRVFSGLMDIMTDQELLGIIGHEIGHVMNKDTKDAFRNALLTSALREGISSAGGTVGKLSSSQLGNLGETLAGSQFSQKQEYAADDYGYEFLKSHGINPVAMAMALNKLWQMELEKGSGYGGVVNQLFSTHPDIAARTIRMIERARKEGYMNDGVAAGLQPAAGVQNNTPAAVGKPGSGRPSGGWVF